MGTGVRRRDVSAVLVVAGVATGCGARGGAAVDGGAPPLVSAAGPSTATRSEVVAEADRLAVEGTRVGGDVGAELLRGAHALRVTLWRRERREADALEAIELLQNVERAAPTKACDAALDRALLEAELRTDPATAYRAVVTVRAAHPGEPCLERVDAVLGVWSAYRPLPSVVRELERGAHVAASATASVAPAASPGSDVITPLPDEVQKGPLRITAIERYAERDAARIVVALSRAATFDVGFLPGSGQVQPRLYVDLRGATFAGKRDVPVGGIVSRVRLGEQKDGTRVVLDLATDAHRRVFYLPEPFRVVIDVSKDAPQASMVAEGATRRIRRVVLDPGHGGHDPGAIGPAGLQEKDVTLDIAHRAAPLIARELGLSTLLTRDTDDFVPLDERTARANAFQADLFISIHCNASEDPAARGVMTFVLADSQDSAAQRVAARENAASASAAEQLAQAMGRLLDASSVGRSAHFAELLQRSAAASLATGYGDQPMMGVKRAGFYVLAGAHMPAVLFETTFISNPTDEHRLDLADYRQKIADALVNAVRAYRDGI